jgi:hypothetical protein
MGGMYRTFSPQPFNPIHLYIIDGEMTWFDPTVILAMDDERKDEKTLETS